MHAFRRRALHRPTRRHRSAAHRPSAPGSAGPSRLPLLVAALAVPAGCVTAPLPGDPVKDAEADAVTGCTALGALEVRSLRDSGSPSADLMRAKELLLSKARTDTPGATHLVVTERDLRGASAIARGTAYRCPASRPAP